MDPDAANALVAATSSSGIDARAAYPHMLAAIERYSPT